MVVVGGGRGKLFVTADARTGSGFVGGGHRSTDPVVAVGATDVNGSIGFGAEGLFAAGAGKGGCARGVDLGDMLVQAAFLKKGAATAVHSTGVIEFTGVLFHVVKHSRADRLCFTAGGTYIGFDGFVHRRLVPRRR